VHTALVAGALAVVAVAALGSVGVGVGVGGAGTGAAVGDASALEGAAGSSVRLQAQLRTNQESAVMRKLGLRCMMMGF
jgi:hypothetical protein